MKKGVVFLVTFAMILCLMCQIPREIVCYASASFYGSHGDLSVSGTSLVDKNGQPVQLKGVSSHGINWDVGYPYVNEKAFKSLKKWGVNTIRLAMYTEDYNGYCVTDSSGRKALLATIDKGVKAAKAQGMYVIIDWHILNDLTPAKHQKEANAFFKKVAKKYKNDGNVIYEICNEPNGGTSWDTIKSYAQSVVKTIRKYSRDSIIIVGTPNWSQDVDIAADSPITGYSNIMYALHFYAASHKESYQEKYKVAISKGLPVFCSEFGTCEASGNGTCDLNSANKWLDLLDSNHTPYCCWSLSNKAESASLLKSSCKKKGNFKKSNLSKQGKWLIKRYQ